MSLAFLRSQQLQNRLIQSPDAPDIAQTLIGFRSRFGLLIGSGLDPQPIPINISEGLSCYMANGLRFNGLMGMYPNYWV